MLIAEREEFERLSRVLFAGWNVLPSPERLEAYWIGLTDMHLGSFERLVRDALGPDGAKWHEGKLPSVSKLWARYRDRRARARPVEGPPVDPPLSGYGAEAVPGASLSLWQRRANLIGLDYAKHIGADPELALEAWKSLRSIAGNFELLAADHDPEATPELMRCAIVSEFKRLISAREISKRS